MARRKGNAASVAAINVAGTDAVVPSPVFSHKYSALMDDVQRQVTRVTSFLITTVTFLLLATITFAADAFVMQPLLYGFGTPDSVLVYMFKGAKYLVLGIELGYWIYGVFRDCREHAKH